VYSFVQEIPSPWYRTALTVGSIGLVTVAPLTAVIAGFLFTQSTAGLPAAKKAAKPLSFHVPGDPHAPECFNCPRELNNKLT
jgi:hypothetical protein